jgi:hypothetical protein
MAGNQKSSVVEEIIFKRVVFLGNNQKNSDDL